MIKEPSRSQWDRTARVKATIALLLAATAVAGCASASQRSADSDPLEIRVRNNLIPPTSLTISLLPAVGTRAFVGVVSPSQTKTLEYALATPAGPYRLLAETTDGSAMASRQFMIPSDNGVEWNLSLNRIWVTGEP